MTQITGQTKLLGVIGCPIEHSLSPAMHNAALADLALNRSQTFLEYVYLPLRVEPENLESALNGMAALGYRGFNVTIPHKQAIMPYLREVSALARAVGAVNTAIRRGGDWVGTNTDVRGFLSPLETLSRDWSNLEVCVLGSGGSARAVIAACHELNCAAIHVVGRDPMKLQQLQDSLRQTDASISIQIRDWSSIDTLLPDVGLAVNATPMGMHPKLNESPLGETAIALLPPTAIVYDLIYTPRPTQLLALAQRQGLQTIDGLEMLIQQGAAAFELWTGESPSISVMREAALNALG
ncbi:shikimate dehydrogenase [Altericista sp. CCNU0014]|uniref:shikimate dehydrogenase n=1 Tax=Altericista sp. CCNU0014 TaxID=3082949 RepID=UPI00384B2F63